MRTCRNYRYRGYDIVPWRRWASWFVGIYPVQPDLPVLHRFVLGTLAEQQEVAIAEAKRVIDLVLADFDPLTGPGT